VLSQPWSACPREEEVRGVILGWVRDAAILVVVLLLLLNVVFERSFARVLLGIDFSVDMVVVDVEVEVVKPRKNRDSGVVVAVVVE